MPTYEYKVQEQFSDGSDYYDSSGVLDEREALKRLKERRERYGKYGRRFRVVRREVSNWLNVPA